MNLNRSALIASATAAFVAVMGSPVVLWAAEEGAHGGGAAGLPPAINEGLITAIVTLIVFVVLVVVLSKVAWGPISKGLAEREAKIRRDIDEAEAARAKAEASLREYNAQLAGAEGRVRELLAKAAADSEKIGQSMKLQAQAEIEESKERAQKDIEASRDAAIQEIYTQAAELSTNIAEKIIRKNLNPDDQQELVRQSLELFAANGR